MTSNSISLTQELVRCPSVTPLEAGALHIVAGFLAARGFSCEWLNRGEVSNLYVRRGQASPHLCFLGHTDVVPAGDEALWSLPPFAAEVRDGKLYGRGVVDMKGAIGAYLAAIDAYLQTVSSELKGQLPGSLSVLLTTDEEGPALDGIQYVVEQFKTRGEKIDACLGGEPTNTQTVGDMCRVGRRGSLNAALSVHGKGGHTAYPHLARNPLPPLMSYLQKITAAPLDSGMLNFDPSYIEITSIDCANPVSNVIPAQASAKFNIRFNPLHSVESITHYLQESAKEIGLKYSLDIKGTGGPFFCQDEALQNLLREAATSVSGLIPDMSTGGGTSDARFMKDICPVIEFGLVNATAHQADEHIAVEEIYKLAAVYQQFIRNFLKVTDDSF